MKVLLFAFALTFAFSSCGNLSARVEKRACSYDGESYEHVLNYSSQDGFHSVCIEEEFDLAEGEITGFEKVSRAGGFSFILHTVKGSRYILNLNNDGSLVLHRFD